VCLKSDILCNVCQGRLDGGEISKTEVDVSKFLYNLSDKIKGLKDIRLRKVIDSGVLLLIAGRGDAARLVGKSGSVVKTLAKQFNKSIRVVEEAEDLKKFAQDLISPTVIVGINTLYTPEGEIYKIRIPIGQKVYISPENFSEIIESLYNRRAELIVEG
jgi:transcription antitermination factor NusA-like protein